MSGGRPRPDPVIVVPGDSRYEDLIRRGHNPRFANRPEEICLPRSTDEVVQVVTAAVRTGKHVAVRSGGHCGESLVDHPRVRILLDLALMSTVDFDAERRAFVVAAGATMEQVYRSLYFGWGVTVPGGVCLSVGAGGHFCGGGYGALSRSYGTIAEYITAVEVVVVGHDGIAHAVVASNDPADPNHDLWWAHTGAGGGSFGVVTRYWLRSREATGEDPATALPAPPTIQSDLVMWDWQYVADRDAFVRLLANHGRWSECNSASGSPGTALHSVLMVPHQAAGRIVLDVQTDATAPDAERMVDDFIAALAEGVAAPSMQMRSTRSWWQSMLATSVAKDPIPQDAQTRAKVKSGYLRRRFTDEQLATAHRHLTVSSGYSHPQAYLCLVSYGGAVNTVNPSDTALAQRDSILKVLFGVDWLQAAEDATHLRWVREFYRDVYRDTGGVPVPDTANDGAHINYADADLTDPEWNTSGVPWHYLYHKDNYRRLQQAKARWDPLDIFRHALSVSAEITSADDAVPTTHPLEATMTDFPLTGQIWRVDYGEIAFEHDYRVPGKLSFALPMDGSIMTVDLAVTKLRDNLYLLRFEDGDYASMVAIEDLAENTVNTTMFVHKDNSMVNMSGTLSRVDL